MHKFILVFFLLYFLTIKTCAEFSLLLTLQFFSFSQQQDKIWWTDSRSILHCTSFEEILDKGSIADAIIQKYKRRKSKISNYRNEKYSDWTSFIYKKCCGRKVYFSKSCRFLHIRLWNQKILFEFNAHKSEFAKNRRTKIVR